MSDAFCISMPYMYLRLYFARTRSLVSVTVYPYASVRENLVTKDVEGPNPLGVAAALAIVIIGQSLLYCRL